MDRRTDGPTDRRTDRVGYRVACPQLKTYLSQENSLFGGVEGLLFARALPLQSGHLQLGLTHELLVLGELFVGLIKNAWVKKKG